MRKILPLILLICICINSYAQTDRESAKSVVKIIASYYDTQNGKRVKKASSGTGWSWQNGTYVVTTLHTVAGVKDIKVLNYKKESSPASVIRVIHEADLALLKLEKPLGLRPLDLVDVSPNSQNAYHVWGFPHGIPEMQGDLIRFSRGLIEKPKLGSILTGNKLLIQLKKQGYPKPNADILRISSTIQPGHSGAPILTKDGKVIGVADGGLRGGTARINWAMPASRYVPLLLRSNDAIPQSISVQSSLYSSPTIVPVDASLEEEIAIMEKEESVSTVSSDDGTIIHKTWTASFSDIYETLEDDVMEDIDEMMEEDGIEDMFYSMSFDIYEDYETGVSFAVPEGAEVTYHDEMFFVTLQEFNYAFIPFQANSYDEARSTVEEFVNGILETYPNNSYYDGFEEDTYEEDEGEEEYEWSIIRKVNDEGSEYFMAVEGEADEEDGVLILFMSNLIENMDENEKKLFFQFALSSEVYSFSPD